MTPKDLDHLHAMQSSLQGIRDRTEYLARRLDGVTHDRTTQIAEHLVKDIDDVLIRLDAVTGSLVGGQMRAAEESSMNVLNAALAGHTLGSRR